MILSLALIFLCGISLGAVFEKLKLPRLVGMIAAGILIGPHVLNWLSPSMLSVSADLRRIALIIILTRAGLNLDASDLKKVGRPAFLMCFVPACFEIGGMLLLAPKLLGLSLTESAVLGTVLAAVSPAVVVPKMLRLMEEQYGTRKGIPQLILAGASVDDVFVIVLFTTFTGLAAGGHFDALGLMRIPTSIVLGTVGGFVCGKALSLLFERLPMRDTPKLLTVLSVSFLLVSGESCFTGRIGFSGLLAVMSMGFALRGKDGGAAASLSPRYGKLWEAAEPMLFVLVGASVDIGYVRAAGVPIVLLIFGVLLFRVAGVWVCMIRTPLSMSERLFCMIAYTPKATVQAAIGAVPLAMGLACGNTVLTAAVMAILITAPLGAFGIDLTYPHLLTHDGQKVAN